MADRLRTVEATIHYLGNCRGKPTRYIRRKERDNIPLEPHTVQVTDIRPVQGVVSLDREGFALVRHPSKVTDFFEPAQVSEIYVREVEELLKQVTGAAKVVSMTSGVLRRSERSTRSGNQGYSPVTNQEEVLRLMAPARFAHCDFSRNPAGSSFWIERALPPDEAKARLRGRFACYNLWRVLSEPPQDSPLAVCDARSVADADIVEADHILDPPGEPEFRFETSVFHYSRDHRWCYFSGMTRDEVLVFKGYDSDPSRATGVPHSAFNDPSCPPEAPARESMELRAFAFFD